MLSTYGICVIAIWALVISYFAITIIKSNISLYKGTHSEFDLNEEYIRWSIVHSSVQRKAEKIMRRAYKEALDNGYSSRRAESHFIKAYRESLSLITQYFDEDEMHAYKTMDDVYGYHRLFYTFFKDTVFSPYTRLNQFH